jgi:hypothetical protein
MPPFGVVLTHWPGETYWHAVLAVPTVASATAQQIIPEEGQSMAASQLMAAVACGQDLPCNTQIGLSASWSRQHVCVFKLHGVPQAIGPPS